jgi:photosystem II stability/assembly factor-like uncharacterized protein
VPASRIVRLLLLTLLAAGPGVAGADRWTPFGPSGGPIDDVVFAPGVPGTLWIAAGGAVYKSEDGGASFHHSGSGLERQRTVFLAIDPTQPGLLYAATEVGSTGVYRSEDGGASWTLAASLDFISSLSVAPGSPGQPGVLFVGTATRLYRSVDRGASFQAVIDPGLAEDFLSVAPDLRNPGTIYAATLSQRHKSVDFGATWTALDEDPGQEPPFVHDIAVAPGDPQTLYETGDGAGVGATWRSRDGGATWQGPFPFRGDVLAVDPEDADTVYGGSDRGLFVSHDGGETFAPARRALPPSAGQPETYGVGVIAVDPDRPGFALAGTRQGLFATADLGRTWRAPAQRRLFAGVIGDFRIDPFAPAHWLLRSLGSYRETHDGGLTFTPFAAPLRAVAVSAIEFDPFVRGRLWAVGTGALHVSRDGGATWARTGAAPAAENGHLLLPAPRVLLLAGPGIFRSTDAGRTWRQVQSSWTGDPDSEDTDSLGFTRLVQDPRNPRTIYGLAEASHPPGPFPGFPVIYRSDDTGGTWRLWHRGGQAVAFDPRRPRTVHVAQGDALLVTRDANATNATFQEVGRLGLAGSPRVTELLFDRVRPAVLYAATDGDGILQSRDRGATWEPVDDGLPLLPGKITALVQDPVFSPRFYATPESGGLYRADFTGGRP